ncbi:Tigger transposable element-derived protein 4 [Araneus ventricosus]|uniref:Tigger transposable element-derived protein 4 n=1 Tax=Araneus ventricosus TaxID=182803 RepID=A0A4Y2K4A7_ARAVE|nr:Tigger transposable element-derived protein 4 [Araneus ventricosus]
MRSGDCPEVEKCLMKCISQYWAQNIPLRRNILRENAEDFGKQLGLMDLKASSGWFENLKKKDYNPQNIFNADETGLLSKYVPDKTIAIKGEACHGGKKSKERVLLCANMNGSEKLKPLMIGKSKKPTCFAGVKFFPMNYEANTKAWMTGELFVNWLKALDRKMACQKRKIVLFIDNCEAHPSAIILQL